MLHKQLTDKDLIIEKLKLQFQDQSQNTIDINAHKMFVDRLEVTQTELKFKNSQIKDL